MKVERNQFWDTLRRQNLSGTILHVFGDLRAKPAERDSQCQDIERLLMAGGAVDLWCRVGLVSYAGFGSTRIGRLVQGLGEPPSGTMIGVARTMGGRSLERFSLLEAGSIKESTLTKSTWFHLEGERVKAISRAALYTM